MIRNFLKSASIASTIRRDSKNIKNFHRLFIRTLSVEHINVNFSKISVKTNFQNEMIELYDDDASSTKPFEFPFIWLRDNCQVRDALSSFT